MQRGRASWRARTIKPGPARGEIICWALLPHPRELPQQSCGHTLRPPRRLRPQHSGHKFLCLTNPHSGCRPRLGERPRPPLPSELFCREALPSGAPRARLTRPRALPTAGWCLPRPTLPGSDALGGGGVRLLRKARRYAPTDFCEVLLRPAVLRVPDAHSACPAPALRAHLPLLQLCAGVGAEEAQGGRRAQAEGAGGAQGGEGGGQGQAASSARGDRVGNGWRAAGGFILHRLGPV
jgi:hypothetical protein